MVCQPGYLRHGEIKAHHRVHGNHQRRCQAGQQDGRSLVTRPMHGGTAPAHRQHPVNNFRGAVSSAIAQRGQVRNQSYEPEEQRYGGVCGDREHVPDQRAAKLRPQPHRVGVRREPVKKPRAAHVQQREHSGAGHRKERHGFGETVDRSAPLLSQQQQNRGNQCAGVADADPPHEIDDGEAPADGDVDAPDAYALNQQVANGEIQEHQQREGNRETEDPALGRAASEHNGADLVGDSAQRITRLNNRMSRCRFDGTLRAFRVHVVASEHSYRCSRAE